jgi:hypothetical protein
MRRAQLSMMIIIGLVVVVLVAIGYYVINLGSQSASANQLQQAQIAPELVRPVEQFADGCLRVASTQALQQLGAQGGVLYTSQGGLVDDSALVEGRDVLTVEGKRVWYGLQRPEGQVGDLYFATPPDYPWQTFPLLFAIHNGTTEQLQDFHGFFGFERLPSLNGTFEAPAAPTIEQDLASAVAADVAACLDWSKLVAPVNVTSGQPQVTVLVDNDDTTFILNASISVESGGRRTLLRLSSLRTPVRLLRVYEAAKLVLGLDGTDISVNADSIDTGVIAHHSVAVPGTADDIIVFVDNAGKLDGNPYQFVTARQDRPPALAFIQDPRDTINLCQGATVRRQGGHLLFSASACDADGKSGRVPAGDERYPEFSCWSPGEKVITVRTVLEKGAGQEEEIADGASYTVSELDYRSGNVKVRVVCSETDNPSSADWHDVYINVTAMPQPQP